MTDAPALPCRSAASRSSETGPPDEVVVARALSRTFAIGRREVAAVRGVDLTVRRGELLAVVGASGSGKSTLLHLLGGLLTPSSGHIRIAGHDLERLTDAERTAVRRRAIGFVFQRFFLFATLSVEANLRAAASVYARSSRELRELVRRGQELLASLGLADRAGHRPGELSGGEQQRVAIARALLHDPALFLADEPTGNLDSTATGTVLALLREINRSGQTIVVITHDPDVARVADRRVTMKDGRLLDAP